MTTAQAIAAADALRPANPYTAEQKTGWLSALDGRLHLGVVCGAPEDAPCYTAGAEETLLADTRRSYVVARATSLAGATDLSGWTCKLNGTVTDKVTFKIKGGTVLAKVRRGLVFLIR